MATQPAEEAIPQLIMLEREATVDGNLTVLAELWHPQARIVDGRNTLTAADDYRWEGHAAVMDRYQVAVFPAPPPPFTAQPAPTMTIDDDHATARNQGDRWQFVREQGRWWLLELVYQQPD